MGKKTGGEKKAKMLSKMGCLREKRKIPHEESCDGKEKTYIGDKN